MMLLSFANARRTFRLLRRESHQQLHPGCTWAEASPYCESQVRRTATEKQICLQSLSQVEGVFGNMTAGRREDGPHVLKRSQIQYADLRSTDRQSHLLGELFGYALRGSYLRSHFGGALVWIPARPGCRCKTTSRGCLEG